MEELWCNLKVLLHLLWIDKTLLLWNQEMCWVGSTCFHRLRPVIFATQKWRQAKLCQSGAKFIRKWCFIFYWCLNFIGATFIKKWCNFLLVPEFNKIHKTNAFIGASFLLVLNLLENGAIACWCQISCVRCTFCLFRVLDV